MMSAKLLGKTALGNSNQRFIRNDPSKYDYLTIKKAILRFFPSIIRVNAIIISL